MIDLFQYSPNQTGVLDLIRTNAVFNQRKRESQEVDSIRCVITNRVDFVKVVRLYETLNSLGTRRYPKRA